MITDLKQVPLGPVVKDFVLGYDRDPEQHVELVIDILLKSLHGGYYFESHDEAAAYCRERRLLRQYYSIIRNRERACAYAEYLDIAVNGLNGKEQPLISTTLGPDIHRSEWIRSEELRTAVTRLQEELNRAVFWFNINLVATWFTWITPLWMEWPEILKEIDQFEIGPQAHLLDRLCFGHGTTFLRGCSSHCAAIASLEDVPRETRNIFLLTPRQLLELARLRIGVGSDEADPSVFDEVALEEPEPPPEPQERRTPGGIYLPY
jgi:hypothetical protein